MSNTLTPNYGLKKPYRGDTGWHVPLNENWDALDARLKQHADQIGALQSGGSAAAAPKRQTVYEASVDASGYPTYLASVSSATRNVVPTMTSNTSPSGVASASSIWDASRDAWRAFDGDTSYNSAWGTANGSTTGWLAYQLPEAKVLAWYTIYPKADGGADNQNPRDWTFEGSNDGTTWTVLDTQVNQTGWLNPYPASRTFYLSTTDAYLHYRLNITANGGSPSLVALAALELYELPVGFTSRTEVQIRGAATPVRLSIAGGFTAAGAVDHLPRLTTDVTAWTVPLNTTAYLYAEYHPETQGLSYGFTTVEPIYGAAFEPVLIPIAMTADESGGFVASASSIYSGSYPAYMAFNQGNDGNGDFWVSANAPGPHWLQMDFGERPRKILKYAVRINESWPSTAPKQWTFEGSNDGTVWTVLDTQVDQTTWVHRQDYTLATPGTYRYYRMNGMINNGYGSGETDIRELLLFEFPQAFAQNLARGGTASASSNHPGGNHNAGNAFAGNGGSGYAGTTWLTADNNGGAAWLQYQLPQATVVNRYAILPELMRPGNNPKTWTFEGSNGGSSWTVLDTQTGHADWSAGKKTFDFPNAEAYLYYRLNVTANVDPASDLNRVGLGELEFYYAAADLNTDLHWFDTDAMQMKVWSGTQWLPTLRLFMAEAVTDSKRVTTLRPYALNGIYDSGWFLIAGGATAIKSHNLGVPYPKILGFYATAGNGTGAVVDVPMSSIADTNTNYGMGLKGLHMATTVAVRASGSPYLDKYITGATSARCRLILGRSF